MEKDVRELKRELRKSTMVKKTDIRTQKKVTKGQLLSSGSTVLNLALSDSIEGAFRKGCYYYLVGDSSSGKTFLSMTCFAEATIQEDFKKHRLIFDDVENGALMNLEKFFGRKVSERIEAPKKVGKERVHSTTIEDFYFNIDDAIEEGTPFIYVLDSMDALTSEKEREEFAENKALSSKGKGANGSYGDGKAKKNSSNIRTLINKLKNTDSILIIISQTRDNIGFGFEKKTRSGGRSLRFYATCEVWTSIKSTISKTIRGVKREIGKTVDIKIKKNRQTGRERKINISIYPSYGIDDIESSVNFLIQEGFITGNKKKIKVPDFNFDGSIKKFIAMIEEENLENAFKEVVGKAWEQIEKECSLQRKKRYI